MRCLVRLCAPLVVLAPLVAMPVLETGPAAAAASSDAQVASVSCPSAGSCSAGGSYVTGSGTAQAFVISEKSGRWGRAEPVPGVAALNSGGNAAVGAVSCSSAGTCGAAGTYQDSSRRSEVFVVSEKNGAWGRARQLPGSAALVGSGPNGVFGDWLSCSSAGNCATGGAYADSAGKLHSFVASEVHGRWGSAIQILGGSHFPATGDLELTSLSCGPAGYCSAGGIYGQAGTSALEAFVVDGKNGRWGKAEEVPGSAALNTAGDASVSALSCPSAGRCTAVGAYRGADGWQAFVVDQKNGRWGNAEQLPGLQALNVGGQAVAGTVSCSSAGDCGVGGYYAKVHQTYPTTVRQQAFVAFEQNGTWGRAQPVPGSPDPERGQEAAISDMSCSSPGNCGATETYSSYGTPSTRAFVVNAVGGRWRSAILTRGWAAIGSQGDNQIGPVSCASSGNCSAGGMYLTAAGWQGFVIGENNGVWGTAQEIQAPG
jgi:hypothetical protein